MIMLQALVKFPDNSSYSSLNNLHGYILFTQYNKNTKNNNEVIVEVNLSGLPPGKHGFHIHENKITQYDINQLKKGIIIKNLCDKLGGHFNPFRTHHGSYRFNTDRHAGDLINNLEVDQNGIVKIKFLDPLISLNKDDPNCIIGRSIVIHEKFDDEGLPGINALLQNKKLNKNEIESLKTGNAGKRIACGNINTI